MRSTRRRELSPTGEDAASYLAEDHARQGRLLQHVSAWYEKATGHRVTLLDEADRFRIVLSPLDNAQVEVDLIDTGEGMAQVLPVLVLIARAIEGYLAFGPTIAIEHPELHLHPRAERELASLFCSLARLRSSRVLIETHSQNFLLQVQLALLASTLTPEDVIVYWIRELPDGQGVVDRIVFDELAVPVGNAWPPDVFGEELAQAREILLARRNKA
jgi:predicted ATPase